tara:strand:- start:75 stop:1058 length:984 start_codon:yes stop_codon:yes gene_type:complete
MRYLITGVAGFVGFHLANKLCKNKKNIIFGIDNLNNYYSKKIKKERLLLLKRNKNFKFYKLNLESKKSVQDFFKKNKDFKVIFHLAAQPGVQFSLKNRESYFNNNLKVQFNILESIVNSKSTKQFIYGSSSSVYGEISNKKEDYRVDLQESFYAATKRICEIMTDNYSRLFKIKSTGLRFFTVYGPYGRPDMSPLIFLKAVYKGKIIKLFNQGNSLRSFTYITDVVDIIEKSSKNKSFLRNKKKYHKIYNIGNDKNISTFNFLKLIEKNLKKKAKFKKTKNRKADIKNTKANIFLAKKELKFKPKVNFSQGVKLLCEWFENSSNNFK